jgi:UDP-N-acetylglucosamine--N-acetylmuramyl-(pentapeptide) pyrophosphoryl-undecaprenol N-acetylglucosamine transferase
MKKLLFTGGHYNSAIATIDKLRELNPDYQFVWVGRKSMGKANTPEFVDVSSRKIPFYNISAGKFYRIRTIFLLHKVIWSLILVPVGFIQAFFINLKERPDIIVSFGGYMALPVVITGWLLRIKSVTHEQTVIIGLANKIMERFVDRIFVSWPVEYYKGEVSKNSINKLKFTGVPLNPYLLSINEKFSIDDPAKPTIYITGGKNGSLFINRLIIEAYDELKNHANIIWSTGIRKGEADFDEIMQKTSGQGIIKEYFFAEDVAKAIHTADLVITRAGAHTIYELAAMKKPAIVIPIPWATKDEQRKNARILENMGIGRILEEDILTKDKIILEVKSFLEDISNGNVNVDSSIVVKDGTERICNAIIEILESKK